MEYHYKSLKDTFNTLKHSQKSSKRNNFEPEYNAGYLTTIYNKHVIIVMSKYMHLIYLAWYSRHKVIIHVMNKMKFDIFRSNIIYQTMWHGNLYHNASILLPQRQWIFLRHNKYGCHLCLCLITSFSFIVLWDNFGPQIQVVNRQVSLWWCMYNLIHCT